MLDASTALPVIGVLTLVCTALATALIATIIYVRRYVRMLRKQQRAESRVFRHLLRLAYADMSVCPGGPRIDASQPALGDEKI